MGAADSGWFILDRRRFKGTVRGGGAIGVDAQSVELASREYQ